MNDWLLDTYALVGWTIGDLREVIDAMGLPKRTDEELRRFMERNTKALNEAMCRAGYAALEELATTFPEDFSKEES